APGGGARGAPCRRRPARGPPGTAAPPRGAGRSRTTRPRRAERAAGARTPPGSSRRRRSRARHLGRVTGRRLRRWRRRPGAGGLHELPGEAEGSGTGRHRDLSPRVPGDVALVHELAERVGVHAGEAPPVHLAEELAAGALEGVEAEALAEIAADHSVQAEVKLALQPPVGKPLGLECGERLERALLEGKGRLDRSRPAGPGAPGTESEP